MLVLAIECAALAIGLALADGDTVLDETIEERATAASESLLLAVDEALVRAGRTRQDLGGIAVTHGPGAFTGVRVGLAAAQGLALGLDLPLATVSTLDVLIQPHLAPGVFVVAALDARRQQFYAAAADTPPASPADDVVYTLSPRVAAAEDVARDIAALAGDRAVLVVGTGAQLLAPHLIAAGVRETGFGDPAFDIPRPATLARLGAARFAAGRTLPVEQADAHYLRGADARTLAERAAARAAGS